jgi:CheY-like chemotaxis protein
MRSTALVVDDNKMSRMVLSRVARTSPTPFVRAGSPSDYSRAGRGTLI